MHKFLLDKNSIKTFLEQNNGHSSRWLRSTSFLGGFSWGTFWPVAKKVQWPPALISTNLDDDVSTLMTMFRPWWWCLDPPWFEERERRKWAPRAPMAWRGLCSEAWRDPRCHCCHCNHVHCHWHDHQNHHDGHLCRRLWAELAGLRTPSSPVRVLSSFKDCPTWWSWILI